MRVSTNVADKSMIDSGNNFDSQISSNKVTLMHKVYKKLANNLDNLAI